MPERLVFVQKYTVKLLKQLNNNIHFEINILENKLFKKAIKTYIKFHILGKYIPNKVCLSYGHRILHIATGRKANSERSEVPQKKTAHSGLEKQRKK